MEYFKNPIIVGLIISFASYVYLRWDYSEHPENEKPTFKYPIILGLLAFLILSIWSKYKKPIFKIQTELSLSSPVSPKSIGDTLPRVFLETIH
jgi:uncharacterized membrane protein